MSQQTLAQRLAHYVAGINLQIFNEQDFAEAQRRVVDSIGCALGALGNPPAMIAQALAKEVAPAHQKSPRAALWFSAGHVTSPDVAAFANGVLVRYLDFNDTYLSKEPAHPSDNIAALLAVAESVGASGKQFLASVILAYEIQCRFCDAASLRERGWDHVTYGSISVALAAGWLMGLSETQLVHALGLAINPNNAMRQTRVGELSHWKGCAFANAARNGVFAARLAQLGMTGPAPIFEGEMGFFKQVFGLSDPTQIQLPMMAHENGNPEPFMIHKTYIKHFPAEYHSQTAIEAALEIRDLLPPEHLNQLVDLVQSVTIESFDVGIEIIASKPAHWAPQHRETADHSLPYCTAVALLEGIITPDSFDEAHLGNPTLREFLKRVTVERSEEMNAGYPDGIPNRVTVTFVTGETYTSKISYALGHPKNAMSDEEVTEKFTRQATGVIASDRQEAILNAAWDLTNATSVSQLAAVLG
ncbi:MAG: MmgE/PrpD family protein [Vampirovibrionales bacterium]|nr:MmgE/PrpD family protein [Vampirovibrionales bacterium]